jgi:uncharacterized membrane protein YraQ (UPF0718 family)
MNTFMRYKWVLVFLAADAAIMLWDQTLGQEVVRRTKDSFVEMLSFVPPVFLLLGLLDVWVPREKVIAHLGPASGITGLSLAVFLGAAAAGPLYAAFPVAAVMIRKGASFFNVMVFIGAWSTLKVPMFLFEMQCLGQAFATTRWILSLTAIVAIAFFLDRVIPAQEKDELYRKHVEANQEKGDSPKQPAGKGAQA